MEDIIEQMKQLVNEFDFANFIPAVDSILGWIEMLVRIFVMAAPICILAFGLFFLFLPPRKQITVPATAPISVWAVWKPGGLPSFWPASFGLPSV